LYYKVIKLGRTPCEIEFTVKRSEQKQEVKTLDKNTLSPPILEKAKWIVGLANDMLSVGNSKWDLKDLEKQFWDFARKSGMPKDTESAFIGFIKKKISPKRTRV